jgi:uncharacterized protein YdhG (YjbR/CyaY superfamily)
MHPEVRAYLEQLPTMQRERLEQLRKLVFHLVPEAEEGFSYQMPSYKYKGKPLIYFASFSKHIGCYALPNTHSRFSEQLSGYKQGKGSVQFPHHQELPYDLIGKMILFRNHEILQAG